MVYELVQSDPDVRESHPFRENTWILTHEFLLYIRKSRPQGIIEAMQIASWISKLSEPMILVVGLMVLGAYQQGIRGASFNYFVAYIMFFFLASFGLRMFAMKKLNTNWDISDREKRIKSLVPFLGLCAVIFSCLLFWRNPGLTRFGIGLLVWLVGFSLITTRTKISGHMSILTLVLGYMIMWFGAYWWVSLISLPFVAWSRLVLKRHTIIEVIGGVLYSLVFLLMLRMIFGNL